MVASLRLSLKAVLPRSERRCPCQYRDGWHVAAWSWQLRKHQSRHTICQPCSHGRAAEDFGNMTRHFMQKNQVCSHGVRNIGKFTSAIQHFRKRVSWCMATNEELGRSKPRPVMQMVQDYHEAFAADVVLGQSHPSGYPFGNGIEAAKAENTHPVRKTTWISTLKAIDRWLISPGFEGGFIMHISLPIQSRWS